MPISEKQFAANLANAARSTGPRSPEGKARSAQNARTHGFTASTFTVVRLEELDEIARLKHDLLAVYQPVNSQELFALEQMALAQQTRLRAARLESGIFTTCLDMALNHDGTPFIPMSPDLVGGGDIEITHAQNCNYALADGFHRLARKDNTFPLFLRYKIQTERLYRRAVEEFDRLKALRPELPNEAISEPQPEEKEPTYAPPNEPISTPQPNPQPEPPPEPAGQAPNAACLSSSEDANATCLSSAEDSNTASLSISEDSNDTRLSSSEDSNATSLSICEGTAQMVGQTPGLRPAPWPASPFQRRLISFAKKQAQGDPRRPSRPTILADDLILGKTSGIWQYYLPHISHPSLRCFLLHCDYI
jgi:hypothetical protein